MRRQFTVRPGRGLTALEIGQPRSTRQTLGLPRSGSDPPVSGMGDPIHSRNTLSRVTAAFKGLTPVIGVGSDRGCYSAGSAVKDS
uniref:Uncharacterized protein n=1 Tax=Engystomops pustulosus TaxID=76066 RepID=A0AAV6YZT1_ENGPU|nr:hypothetical protein GDO81_018735 [Engystomops pustulosus]